MSVIRVLSYGGIVVHQGDVDVKEIVSAHRCAGTAVGMSGGSGKIPSPLVEKGVAPGGRLAY
ncbi:MAG: hypothetical protein B0D87_07720, partial [Candidatus Sedimenticola endophacoides]